MGVSRRGWAWQRVEGTPSPAVHSGEKTGTEVRGGPGAVEFLPDPE